jgi:hypothetical protein
MLQQQTEASLTKQIQKTKTKKERDTEGNFLA